MFTTVAYDRVELVETDDTYLELWERRRVQDRGAWLVEHGFRVTATKEHVTVSQGTVRGEAWLDEPERKTTTGSWEQVSWGKCECGCGTDLYGVEHSRKRYLNLAHKANAKRQRAAADNAQSTESREP
jgi:hypothetical protein